MFYPQLLYAETEQQPKSQWKKHGGPNDMGSTFFHYAARLYIASGLCHWHWSGPLNCILPSSQGATTYNINQQSPKAGSELELWRITQ
jgi:hypothetical protein